MEMVRAACRQLYAGARDRLHIISMTLSLVGRVHPGAVSGGIVGRLLHEFAVTIRVAILVSGFVSLSLTPMLCSASETAQEDTRQIYMFFERFFDGMASLYDRTLKVVFTPSPRHRDAFH